MFFVTEIFLYSSKDFFFFSKLSTTELFPDDAGLLEFQPLT